MYRSSLLRNVRTHEAKRRNAGKFFFNKICDKPSSIIKHAEQCKSASPQLSCQEKQSEFFKLFVKPLEKLHNHLVFFISPKCRVAGKVNAGSKYGCLSQSRSNSGKMARLKSLFFPALGFFPVTTFCPQS